MVKVLLLGKLVYNQSDNKIMKKIKKAILPVAGKGTRMMPLTMHQPKGMIALADKPMIHYVLDEMRASGIEEVIMVLGENQEVFFNKII